MSSLNFEVLLAVNMPSFVDCLRNGKILFARCDQNSNFLVSAPVTLQIIQPSLFKNTRLCISNESATNFIRANEYCCPLDIPLFLYSDILAVRSFISRLHYSEPSLPHHCPIKSRIYILSYPSLCSRDPPQ